MTRLRKLTEEQVRECVYLYQDGMSCGELAARFGVTRQDMWDVLRLRTVMRSNKRMGSKNHFYRGGVTADDRAQNLLEQALRDGTVTRMYACENCGDSGAFRDGRNKVQAHHDDYNKPLAVRWLCQKCHHKWHKENRAKEKDVLPTSPTLRRTGISTTG
jgi:predicted DNA-binding protein YlxM (UPF0122 family)